MRAAMTAGRARAAASSSTRAGRAATGRTRSTCRRAAAVVVAAVRRPGGQARQPLGLEPVRQRRRLRGARHPPRRPRRRGSARCCARRASRSSSRRRTTRRSSTRRRRAGSSARAPSSTRSGRSPTPRGRRTSSSASTTTRCARSRRARSARLGVRRAWVVRGEDGLDEVSPCATDPGQRAGRGRRGARARRAPEDFGLARTPRERRIAGGDAADNASALRAILRGEAHPARDAVVLNAAAALSVATGEDLRGAADARARSPRDGARPHASSVEARGAASPGEVNEPARRHPGEQAARGRGAAAAARAQAVGADATRRGAALQRGGGPLRLIAEVKLRAPAPARSRAR